MCRSLIRTTPAGVETWKAIFPCAPITNSVEPPPMSITTERPSGAPRADIAPANVIWASSSPLRMRVWRGNRAATSAANSSPLDASRTAEVITATARSADSICGR